MLTPAQIEQTRREVRRLRIYTQQLKRLQLSHKDKADRLEDILEQKDKRIRELEKEKGKLQEDLEKVSLRGLKSAASCGGETPYRRPDEDHSSPH